MNRIPLGPPRTCPVCRESHPPGTTCANGRAPWRPPVPVPITLTDEDMEHAREHAREVIASNKRHRYHNQFEPEEVGREDLGVKVSGYAAEIAAARVTGLSGPHWEVFGAGYRRANKSPDIGQRTDVKSTAGQHLWVGGHDKRDFVFLLVTGTGPEYLVVGWAEGEEVMERRFWVEREPRSAYRIPQWALRPLPLPEDA